jgi:hypothetical protein
MKTHMLARVASLSLLLTGAACLTPACAQSAGQPGASPPPVAPLGLPNRYNGATITPIPGARPMQNLNIPKPYVSSQPPQGQTDTRR